MGIPAPLKIAACLSLLFAGCTSAPKPEPEAVRGQAPTAAPAQKSSMWSVNLKGITQDVTSMVTPVDPPAAELICMWQTHVSYLPDPTRNGTMSPGLAGQVYLFDKSMNFARVNGKVTVDLLDETAVRHGGQAKLMERWVFPKEILRQLVGMDETFGKNYTLFLPWPTYKPEIKQVRLMVKYEPEQGTTLFAPAESLTLAQNRAVIQQTSERIPVKDFTSRLANPGMPSPPVTMPAFPR